MLRNVIRQQVSVAASLDSAETLTGLLSEAAMAGARFKAVEFLTAAPFEFSDEGECDFEDYHSALCELLNSIERFNWTPFTGEESPFSLFCKQVRHILRCSYNSGPPADLSPVTEPLLAAANLVPRLLDALSIPRSTSRTIRQAAENLLDAHSSYVEGGEKRFACHTVVLEVHCHRSQLPLVCSTLSEAVELIREETANLEPPLFESNVPLPIVIGNRIRTIRHYLPQKAEPTASLHQEFLSSCDTLSQHLLQHMRFANAGAYLQQVLEEFPCSFPELVASGHLDLLNEMLSEIQTDFDNLELRHQAGLIFTRPVVVKLRKQLAELRGHQGTAHENSMLLFSVPLFGERERTEKAATAIVHACANALRPIARSCAQDCGFEFYPIPDGWLCAEKSVAPKHAGTNGKVKVPVQA